MMDRKYITQINYTRPYSQVNYQIEQQHTNILSIAENYPIIQSSLMQRQSVKSQLLKTQFTTQLFSPRTTYSNYLKQMQLLKTNMIINIDKYVLGNLKTQFEKRNREVSMVEFMFFCKKFLKEWNTELPGREVKMQQCLNQLWEQIDRENEGKITWEDFNSKIIETSLNLKSLSSNAGIQAPTFNEFIVPINPSKHETPIAKIVYINKKNKMAYFREQSTQIQFFSAESPQLNTSDTSQTKPIFLPQQELKVQTLIKVKQKNENNTKSIQKITKGVSKMIKRDVKVSSFKNTVLDAIYLNDSKYDMLIVSCSDKNIRGYNVQNLVPVIANQPQNEDEPMLHAFSVQMYNMAWDDVNEVLYATGKGPTIYQWLVKTDADREMIDAKGHEGMISAIFVMSKLQLLATGGFDGKLILWDTVGQEMKMKYQEHTRAISAISFHQGLVLLFTAALDHKICVWNPYIGSLIHKIDNALNVIQLQIIPNTNYMISADCGGNVKIREINRFTQVTNFSIFRLQNPDENDQLIKHKVLGSQKQKQFPIAMCSKKEEPIQYYFGTDTIVGYRFTEVQKTIVTKNNGTISSMKYDTKEMKLYTPIRNHIIVWNLLTGVNQEIFYDMAENDITSFEFVQELGFFIVGDTEGSVTIRRNINGSLINKLLRMKSPVKNIKFYELQRAQSQKTPHKASRLFHLICGNEEGEIIIQKCSSKGEFEPHRQFSLKHDFNIHNANITALEQLRHKNVLIVALSTNQIICVDVEKKSLLVKIGLGHHSLLRMDIVRTPEKNNFLVVVSKFGELLPFYLPPHNKKFKNSSLLNVQNIGTVESSVYGHKTRSYFLSIENGDLICVNFDPELLQSSQQLQIKWRAKIQHRVFEMLLIQKQQVLVLLEQSENFTFISTENGEVICHLSQSTAQRDQSINHSIQPILYLKEKSNEILIPKSQKLVKFQGNDPECQKQTVKKVIDPFHFITLLSEQNIDNFNKLSNTSWKLNLNIPRVVQERIRKIEEIGNKIKTFSQTPQLNGSKQMGSSVQKAIELQKKWQKEKDQEQLYQEQENGQHSETIKKESQSGRKSRNSTTKFDITAFDKMIKKVVRGNSLGSLWKQGQKTKKHSQFSVHIQSKAKQHHDPNKIKKFNQLQQFDLIKLQKDPLYRLGLALKNVNTQDRQAQHLIELAKRKEELKLPKIGSNKIKL